MFDHFLETLKEKQRQQGQRDRKAGILPTSTNSIYLESYLQDRPEGIDGIIQYFPSLESYLNWKYHPSDTSPQ